MRRDPQLRTGEGRAPGRARLAGGFGLRGTRAGASRLGRRRPRAAAHAGLLALLAALLTLLVTASLATAASGPTLTVDATADRHPIAPEIYGMSFADPQLAAEIGLPLNRWGGNTTDRYNWRIDTWNTGWDWYFENTSGCWNSADNWCEHPPSDPSQGYRRILDGDRAVGAARC